MILYHNKIKFFEFRTEKSNLFCQTYAELRKQALKIYGVNTDSLLN